MIKNSPVFMQKIMTLVIFSLFFSFLTSIFDFVDGTEQLSRQTAILMMLGTEIFFGLIYFILIYFCLKRKNIAKIIFAILLILGILGFIFTLLTEEILLVQGIFYVVCTILDIYTLTLLFGEQAKNFFNSGYVQNIQEGSYKAWFSTLSSVLFVVMMGAKFSNKYDSNHQPLVGNKSEEIQLLNEAIASEEVEDASVKATNSEANEEDVPTSAAYEKLNCKDPKVIAEFTDTINSSPSALNNNLRIVDVDTDYVEEISFTANPYELQCSVAFTFNDGSNVNYLMRIYDKNGKGKMMIEGTPLENEGE